MDQDFGHFGHACSAAGIHNYHRLLKDSHFSALSSSLLCEYVSLSVTTSQSGTWSCIQAGTGARHLLSLKCMQLEHFICFLMHRAGLEPALWGSCHRVCYSQADSA